MKKQWYYLMLMALATLFMVSCDDDDDGNNVIDVPIYGFQVTGTATDGEVYVIDQSQVAEPNSDFATKELQAGMNYGIYWLKAGDLSFKNVTTAGETAYGVDGATTVEQSAEVGGDDDMITYTAGSLVEDGTAAASVATEGLYYIITDETNMKFWLMAITEFEINVTGDVATLDAGGSAAGCTFSVDGVELRSAFKVRINKAWKFVFEDVSYAGASAADFADDHARPVISYGGGATDGVLAEDAGDITIETEKLLNFTFTWNPEKKGIAGITYATEEGDELPPPAFPENMYMIGGSALGWDWAANAVEMIPVIDQAHLFYKIVWLNGSDDNADYNGIKFCEEKAWGKDFGVTGDAVESVYDKGGDNASVTASGTYIVVVNLLTEKVEVNAAPMIYAISDPAFGTWDAAVAENVYTVDNANKVLVSPAAKADGSLRTHATSPLFTDADGNATDWWRSELSLVSGKIEYRTGDELSVDAILTGQQAKLNFETGMGVIE